LIEQKNFNDMDYSPIWSTGMVISDNR